jgi:hypothetical protein
MEEEGPPPDATPEDMAGMDMGSPVAAEPAPTREPAPAGTAADEATAAEIDAAVQNIAACSAADDTGVALASVVTPKFLLDFSGSENPYDFAAQNAGLRFTDVEVIGNAMTYEDGRVSVDVQFMLNFSEYQLNSERWYLAKEGDVWKLDETRYISASTDMTQSVVGVTLTQPEPGQYAFELGAPSAPATELLTFHAINNGTEVHELLVFQLPEGADPTGILDGSIPEENITFIGAVAPLFPQDNADLNLVNLPAGIYFLVCFLPGPDGAPHAMNGMWTQFEVTAAG